MAPVYNNAVTEEERNWEYARRKIGIDVRIFASKFVSLVTQISARLDCVENLRAPVCKNRTNSKFRGKGGKFDFFHILMSDRLGYN